MKLTKRIVVLLACSAVGTAFVACNGDEKKEDDPGADDVNSMGGGQNNGSTDPDPTSEPGPTGPQCDEPGGSQCTGSASGIVCAEDSTDGVAFVCATGEECKNGACQGICTAGETECVGEAVLRVCTDDGRSWVNIPCQNGSVCDDELGACGLGGGLVCTPGETDCDDGGLRTCADDGMSWDTESCPGDSVCEDGACVGTVCTVGATRCDSTASTPSVFFEGGDWFEGSGSPNFDVIQRCVDGESWVVESCPSDDERTVCTYTDFDRVEAARLRAEVNQWVDAIGDWEDQMELWFFEGNGAPPAQPTPPATPSIPEDSTAACVAVPDGCFLFETIERSPAETRDCADPTQPDAEFDESAFWDGYAECTGLVPFAPIQRAVTTCSGASVCAPWEEELGCQPVDCDPGEVRCSDSDSYEFCFFEGGLDASDVGFGEGMSCPDDVSMGGVAPGTCESTGETPDRSATCNGVDVDFSIEDWWTPDER